VPENGKLAIHSRGRHRPTKPRCLRHPVAIILGNPLSGNLGHRRLDTEAPLELLADLLVLADRALPLRPLVIELFSHKLAECPRFRRRRWRVSFEQSLRRRLLSIPPRPRSVIAPLLLPVDLERIAPGNLADLVSCRPAAAPRSFYDSGPFAQPASFSTSTPGVCILCSLREEQGPCIDG